ncbi:MAG: hydrogenase maturation peptidase HycI [Candidatus Verstraetearchaeota archaeon]|nr:hydrogenase maturation peptidase HycI [Candidatus Verstraetearchaeota archaeon]
MLFEETLSEFLSGYKSLLIVGVGNRMRGDDAAGCSAISRMKGKVKGNVALMDCGETPENYTGEMKRLSPSHILFIDAVEMGAKPGEFRFVDEELLITRSLSTHKQSMRLLFSVLREGIPGVKIMLLGIQPKSIDFGKGISKPVNEGLRTMVRRLIYMIGEDAN